MSILAGFIKYVGKTYKISCVGCMKKLEAPFEPLFKSETKPTDSCYFCDKLLRDINGDAQVSTQQTLSPE